MLSLLIVFFPILLFSSNYGDSLTPFIEKLIDKNKSNIEKINVWTTEDSVRVVLFLSRRVKFKHNLLPGKSGGNRIYVDLLNTALKTHSFSSFSDKRFLKRIRAGVYPDKVRIVLDTGKVKSYNVYLLEEPLRLVIDFFGEKPVLVKKKRTGKKRRDVKNQAKSSTGKGSFLVVIDPGHGGKDPGTVYRGVKEKDIVLRLARIIKRLAAEEKGIKVVLTRERDKFIPLEERAVIANRLGGDLFVSLHVNSFPRDRKVSGIEIYYLDNRRDEYTDKLVMVENKLKNKTSLVNAILVDMTMSLYISDSMKCAYEIYRSMKKNLRSYGIAIRNHKKGALFYVLLGARMPSLLIETGFITNDKERRLLRNKGYLEALARSILKGIKEFARSKGMLK